MMCTCLVSIWCVESEKPITVSPCLHGYTVDKHVGSMRFHPPLDLIKQCNKSINGQANLCLTLCSLYFTAEEAILTLFLPFHLSLALEQSPHSPLAPLLQVQPVPFLLF